MNVELKTSDAELLQTYLRKSDDSLAREQAFRRIVDRYAGLVFAVSFRGVNGDRQLAEDCVQATFIVLARKASSVRKPGMLSAWLHGTARRIATTHVDREAKRRKREQQSMELQEQNQRDAKNRTTEFVLDNLNILSSKLQSVLILHYLEGYSYAETADILECSVDAVGKRIERAVAKLRRHNSRSGRLWGKIGTASLVVPVLSPTIQETCAALGSSAGLKTTAVSAASTQLAVGVIVVMKTKKISFIAAGFIIAALSTSIVIQAGNKSIPRKADAKAGKQATKTTPDPIVRKIDLSKTLNVSPRDSGSPLKPTRIKNAKELVKTLTDTLTSEVSWQKNYMKARQLPPASLKRHRTHLKKLENQLAKLTKGMTGVFVGKVDFKKDDLLYFSWAGSGRDRISWHATADKKKPRAITFLYHQGQTEDLGGHSALYVISKGTAWSVEKADER